MAPQYPNLYQRGRKTTLLTQEEAAERLGISPETLKRYEGGRLTPPDETVARMCEVYGVSWLALEHAKATDRLGILPEVEPKPLPMATISLTNRLRDAADRLAGLLRIDRRRGAPGVRRHRTGPARDHRRGLSGDLRGRKKRTPRGWHLEALPSPEQEL